MTDQPTEAQGDDLPMTLRTKDADLARAVFGPPSQHVGWWWWRGTGFPPIDEDAALFAGPRFHERLEDAWLIVEHLRRREMGASEPLWWKFTDCGARGWRVEMWWAHHDGDIPSHEAVAPTLAGAICAVALADAQGRG